MIESIMIDRLIAQVERRAKAESEVANAKEGLQNLLGTYNNLALEYTLLKAEAERLTLRLREEIQAREDSHKREREAKPKLAALYEAADDLCKEIALSRMRADVKVRVEVLRKALRVAHDACGMIPF